MPEHSPDVGHAPLTQIFADANAVKVQYLAAALDEADVPFTLHETWSDTIETGGLEHRLLVRRTDVPLARDVILEAIAELPALQADLAAAFPDDDEEPPPADARFPTAGRVLFWLALAALAAAVLSGT